jgi:hypothetical protein
VIRTASTVLAAILLLPSHAAASQAFPFPTLEPAPLVPQTLVEVPGNAPGLSREQAAALVQSRLGGRVLSTQPVWQGEQPGYEVRVLLEGKRVRSVYVDAEGNLDGAD